MSLTSLTISSDYGYVIMAAASTFLMNVAHSINTSKYRKAAKMPYPITYATNEEAAKDVKAYQFNCAQRSHANFTENQTSVLASVLLTGLMYPKIAAGLGLAWSVSRYVYMVGYCLPDIKKAGSGRLYGAAGSLISMVLYGYTIATGYKLAF